MDGDGVSCLHDIKETLVIKWELWELFFAYLPITQAFNTPKSQTVEFTNQIPREGSRQPSVPLLSICDY